MWYSFIETNSLGGLNRDSRFPGLGTPSGPQAIPHARHRQFNRIVRSESTGKRTDDIDRKHLGGIRAEAIHKNLLPEIQGVAELADERQNRVVQEPANGTVRKLGIADQGIADAQVQGGLGQSEVDTRVFASQIENQNQREDEIGPRERRTSGKFAPGDAATAERPTQCSLPLSSQPRMGSTSRRGCRDRNRSDTKRGKREERLPPMRRRSTRRAAGRRVSSLMAMPDRTALRRKGTRCAR